MNAGKPYAMRVSASSTSGEWGAIRGKMKHNKSDPARCVNTMCAGPCRTGLEFD